MALTDITNAFTDRNCTCKEMLGIHVQCRSKFGRKFLNPKATQRQELLHPVPTLCLESWDFGLWVIHWVQWTSIYYHHPRQTGRAGRPQHQQRFSIVTFPKDNDKSATSALNRVVTAAKSEGFVEVVRGSCNPTLSKKVEEMQANEKAKKQATEAEFDEKTQATLKRSLGELKGGISHLETKSDEIKSSVETKSDEIKSSFAEMKEEIKIDYKVTINGQAVTIKKHEETITKQQKNIANKDRQIFDLEDKNKKQRHQIAKLNAERDQNAAKLNTERDRNARELREKNQQIAQLNATIESKNQAIFSFSGQTHQITYTEFKAVLEETKEVLAELKECKKRKRDDE